MVDGKKNKDSRKEMSKVEFVSAVCYCTGIPVGALYLVCWTTRELFCKIHLYYCVTMRQVIFQTSRSLLLSTYSWYMLQKLTNYRTWTADTNSTLDISFLLLGISHSQHSYDQNTPVWQSIYPQTNVYVKSTRTWL
jgi:hypothetical protein